MMIGAVGDVHGRKFLDILKEQKNLEDFGKETRKITVYNVSCLLRDRSLVSTHERKMGICTL